MTAAETRRKPAPNYTHRKLNMEPKAVLSIVAAVALLGLALILNPFTVIEAGHRGVVTSFGKVGDEVLGEGIHFRVPIAQSVHEVDVRTAKRESTTAAYSRDSQVVELTSALNLRPDAAAVNRLYQEVGTAWQSVIVDPAVSESVKQVVATYTAQELLDKRAEVKDKIVVALRERLAGRPLIIDDYSITNFDFSDQYEAAVEAKQVAQQQALKAENELERVKFEAEQRVAQAQAEAEAIRIQAQAITSQGGEDYVKLKWIERWTGSLPQTVLGDAVPMVAI